MPDRNYLTDTYYVCSRKGLNGMTQLEAMVKRYKIRAYKIIKYGAMFRDEHHAEQRWALMVPGPEVLKLYRNITGIRNTYKKWRVPKVEGEEKSKRKRVKKTEELSMQAPRSIDFMGIAG